MSIPLSPFASPSPLSTSMPSPLSAHGFPMASMTSGPPAPAARALAGTAPGRLSPPAASKRDRATSGGMLCAARAEALFTSQFPVGSAPEFGAVQAAIIRAVRIYGGTRGCAAEVAAAYGEHPETAAPRMRWARAVVEQTYQSTWMPQTRMAG